MLEFIWEHTVVIDFENVHEFHVCLLVGVDGLESTRWRRSGTQSLCHSNKSLECNAATTLLRSHVMGLCTFLFSALKQTAICQFVCTMRIAETGHEHPFYCGHSEPHSVPLDDEPPNLLKILICTPDLVVHLVSNFGVLSNSGSFGNGSNSDTSCKKIPLKLQSRAHLDNIISRSRRWNFPKFLQLIRHLVPHENQRWIIL